MQMYIAVHHHDLFVAVLISPCTSKPVCKNSKCIPLLFMESSRINFPLNTKSRKFHMNRIKYHICETSKAGKV